MKKICLRVLPVFAACFIVTLSGLAESSRYTPPAAKGEIYVVINYKRGALNAAATTNVSVKWGGFNRSDSVTPPKLLPGRALSAKGFVLHLSHKKNDSVQLTVETDGRIVNGPYQGNPPAEWNNNDYVKVNW